RPPHDRRDARGGYGRPPAIALLLDPPVALSRRRGPPRPAKAVGAHAAPWGGATETRNARRRGRSERHSSPPVACTRCPRLPFVAVSQSGAEVSVEEQERRRR